jgi:DNA protecting protein DprA
MMSSRSELAVLQLMHLPRVGPRTQDKVLSLAAEHRLAVEDVLSAGPERLALYGLKGVTSTALQEARERADELSHELAEHGIRLLVKGEPGYPSSLIRHGGREAPPLLFARGSINTVSRPGVAFCGSRRASETGLAIARYCATELAKQGVNVVSGYANGVDLTAHAAALDVRGATTLVLAEGIFRFRLKPELADTWEGSEYLIVSQFPPRMAWTAGNAMQRNAVILGLAEAAIVIESGTDGGTYAAGETALAAGRPLFVVDYTDPPESAAGNRLLLKQGAHPLPVRPNGIPDLAPVYELLAGEQSRKVSPRSGSQLLLFPSSADE